MRKTKIICTIGPASASEAVLTKMCNNGMNIARLNFSHGTHDDHKEKINLIKKVREKLGLPIAIMLDTKGPEYRVGLFKNGSETLNDGDIFTFTTRDVEGDNTVVSVSYKNLSAELGEGDKILVNNGLLVFTVLETTETDIICKVIEGGVISNRKSMSFPGKVMNQVYLSEQDKSDILFGIQNDVDYIALSFVSHVQDVLDVKNFILENNNGKNDIGLIAKIENRAGIENIEEICSECDGIMIGRAVRGNPWIFREVEHYLNTGESLPKPTGREIRDIILRHGRMELAYKGEYTAIREMRKHIGWYTTGYPNSAALRRSVNEMETYADLENAVNTIFREFCMGK